MNCRKTFLEQVVADDHAVPCAIAARDFHGRLRQRVRRHIVGRRVDEIARQRRRRLQPGHFRGIGLGRRSEVRGPLRVRTAVAFELVLPIRPTERELCRQAGRQRLREVIVAVRQSIRDCCGGPAAQLFARIPPAEPDDDRYGSAMRTRNDQLFAALCLEAVGRAPVPRRLVLRRAPLVEVVLVQQIYRNRTVAFFVDGHRRCVLASGIGSLNTQGSAA
jgi:hypothetical protein